MHKKYKHFSKTFVIVLLSLFLITGAFIPQKTSAETYTLTNKGTATDGISIVGDFSVAGKQAFCCEHDKTTPPTGTKLTSSVKTNANIAKALYYGYGGPEQWQGLGGKDAAIVATSLVIDHYYNGGSFRNPNAQAFHNYLQKKDTSKSGNTYILYKTGSTALQDLAQINPKMNVKINIVKKSANPEITNNNDKYSLSGAKYEVSAGGQLIKTLTTDAAGKASFTASLSPADAKKIKIKEVSAPKGFYLDSTQKTFDGSSGSVTYTHSEVPKVDVVINILKESAKPDYTDNNPNYSLEGAKFQVTASGQVITTLTTDKDGKASYKGVLTPDKAKKILITEISPPSGYVISASPKEFDASKGDINYKVTDKPKGDPVTVLLYKNDRETGKVLNSEQLKQYYPQKAASLADAIFEVNFYKITKAQMPQDKDYSNIKSEKTWYVKTNEKGYARLASEYLADDYPQDSFYMDGQNVTLPSGVLTFKEVKAPLGYKENNELFTCYISTDGDAEYMDRLEEPIISDQIKRGDLKLIKAKEDAFDRLSNVPFKITALEEDGKPCEDGESHIIVTDENGFASTASSHNKHSYNTNANDAALKDGKILDSKLNHEAGIWFGKLDALSDQNGALPYGKYRIDELPCKANEGLSLVSGIEIRISRDNYTVDLGTITDNVPQVFTNAWDNEWKSKKADTTLPRGDVTINDTISYEQLKAGKKYTVKGILMDKDTSEPLLIDGKKIKAEKDFTPKAHKGEVELSYNFDASTLFGKQVVVFEYIYDGDLLISQHADIEDKNQTITFLKPKLKTFAVDQKSNTNYAYANGKVSIIDKVSYDNLLDGQQYVIEGTIMDKKTGEPLLIDGKKITQKTEFFTNTGKGEKEMTFTLDASGLSGKDIVVFEELFWEGEKLAEHADINDENQCIHFPEIKTEAKDSKTKENIANAAENVTIIDTVTYKNVMPGKRYKLEAKVISSSTNEILSESSAFFTAEDSDGKAEVKLTFDASDLKNKSVCIFEKLYFDGEYNNEIIADHEDIMDEKQTVHFPEIKTTAVSDITNKHVALAEEKVRIIDTIEYMNVLPEKRYTVSGKLMCKETGEELLANGKEVVSEKTFIAEKERGFIELEFEFDAKDYEGKTIVAFENLEIRGELIASHEDLNDESQSVHYPKIGTTLIDNVTKDHISNASEDLLIDTVKYENLVIGCEYEIKGVLIDKQSGNPLLIDGKTVSADARFTPLQRDGEVDIEFKFNAKDLKGKSIVAYEELLIDGDIIAEHKDLNDAGQTVTYPAIKTTAYDSDTNMHISNADKSTIIIDKVKYEGLLKDKEYEIKGVLMDKSSNSPLILNDKPVVVRKSFIAKDQSGYEEIEFNIDASSLSGRRIVVFEELYLNGNIIGSHKDIEDEDQAVDFPHIKTKAKDKKTGLSNVTYEKGKNITITDTIIYKNLTEGEKYKVIGTLIDKKSGKPVTYNEKVVTAEKEFIAKEKSGEVSIDFSFNMQELKDTTVVAFEKVYIKDQKEDFKLIGTHEDINDKDQSISIVSTVKTSDNISKAVSISIILMILSCILIGYILRKNRQITKL